MLNDILRSINIKTKYVWKFLQASLIDKTQESYDEMKQQVGKDGYLTLLDYDCLIIINNK